MTEETRARHLFGWTVTVTAPDGESAVQDFNNIIAARLFVVACPPISKVTLEPHYEIIGGNGKAEDE